MRKLINTVFTLCFIIVSMQTARHIYVRMFYDWPSVLDKYNENIDNRIQQSTSLDSLLIEFDKAFNAVKIIEDTASKASLKKLNRYSDEPFISKNKYRDAILDWERKAKTIHEVKVFWIIGIILLLIGLFLFRLKLDRIGIAFIISGFIEMIWWSSPGFSTGGAYLEFIRLLNIKIFFSLITLGLLITLKLISEKKYNKIS